MGLVVMIAAVALLFPISYLIAMSAGATAADPADVSRGNKIYLKYCSGCHGTQGQGDGYRLLGPDPAMLVLPETQERSDADLLFTIHHGKPNMPAWKYRLSPQDSRDVLAYIRSLPRERSQ
ncbi:MAG TPA: cytochrome c [Nitrospira sp.]|nr:cytochrome c [Nitrospira sp.]